MSIRIVFLTLSTMKKKSVAATKRQKMPNNFFDDVYEVVKLIPRGRVTTYGAIGRYLVGWAMNAAHGLKPIPAHRVVNSQGLLSGKAHFETPSTMQKRLEKEGIKVANDKIMDFEKRFWDPSRELA